jgi:hexosaminidase
MKKNILIFCLLLSVKCFSQLNIVPVPSEVKMGKGVFTVDKNTIIFFSKDEYKNIGVELNNRLQKMYGFKLILKPFPVDAVAIPKNKYIRLYISEVIPEESIPGAYYLEVNQKNIQIRGDNLEGLFYGMQTLIQLLPIKKESSALKNYPLSIPQLSITDYPRFPYRGMHLDVGRHFFPVSFIKKYIDYLAAYKFNTFHWHLTEDQGWRIEIKKYPLLTQVGSCRDRTLIGNYGSGKYDSIKYCGYYTQQQIKEIVQYATDRYITVIPEIEMPGHSTAALASYPYLGCTKGPYKVMDTWGVLDDVYCAGNDSTFTFLQNVLDEVMQLFPSKYIHIGGDECPKERWEKCAACQKRMQDNNLKDEHALQSYFIQRMEKYLNSKGRNIIGWDEILEGGLAPNATVMSWRGEAGGIEAAKQNHDVIMTPGSHCYLDHSQSKNEDSLTIGGYLPVEKVYSYEPIPAALNTQQAKHVLGAQGNVWTEYIKNTSKVEYMIFPRMIALSEVLWSPKEKRDWKDFERRLPTIFERLDQQKINYSKAYYDLKATVLPTEDNNGVYWKLESKNKNDKIVYTPQAMDSNMPEYESPIRIFFSGQYVAGYIKRSSDSKSILNDRVYNQITQKISFNKATGKKISLANPPSNNYPGDGAFTLVNGVQNEKGLAKSDEFIGFNGTDLDATIDLGAATTIKEVRLHTFSKQNSWIYHPAQNGITVMISDDGINFTTPENKVETVETSSNGVSKIWFSASHTPVTTRYIKVIAKNFGTIPVGKPGAGEKAWLFVDEIEVE